MANLLHDGLIELGFPESNAEEEAAFCGIPVRPLAQLEPLLERYIALLQEYNAKFDLINTDDHDEIAVRHILDSLAPVSNLASLMIEKNQSGFDSQFTVADIGSGAGLPGIPLAAAFKTIPFVLVERMTKRCGFLQTCVQELGLANVVVEENQAERLAQNRFDVAVFRAFRPLEKKMLRVLRRILKPNGVLAAYKARASSIEAEMNALGANIPQYTVQPLSVPFLADHERNLVIIRK